MFSTRELLLVFKTYIAYRFYNFVVHVAHLWLIRGNEKSYINLKKYQHFCVLLSQGQVTHLLFAGDNSFIESSGSDTTGATFHIPILLTFYLENNFSITFSLPLMSFHLSPSYLPFPSADSKAFSCKWIFYNCNMHFCIEAIPCLHKNNNIKKKNHERGINLQQNVRWLNQWCKDNQQKWENLTRQKLLLSLWTWVHIRE